MKNLVLLLLLTFSLSVFSSGKGVDVTVNLSPAGSFHVTTKKVKGKVIKKDNLYSAKKLYVKIKDLKTGMDLRDEHMKKRLSPKKHPKILVTKLKAKSGKGKAIIEIKGIKKPIKFSYKVSKKMMEAVFKLNLNDFKVEDISYAGVGVKDIITVKAVVPIKSK